MRSPRSLSLLAVLILGSSGCARVADIVVLDKPPPRVSLKGYPLDIAFGDAPIVPEVDSGSTPLAEVAAQVFGPFDEFDDAPPPARQRVAPP
ncbi:MAG TPA: hypothetical protein VM840_06690, partial [Actinomycetota bacterium]|nr:hypothetical protein [Actinomycetota bacterium]